VSEHLVRKDSIGNLRSIDEVHFEETSLEGTLFRLVVLESIEQEGGSLLNHVLTHEDVNDLKQSDGVSN